MASQTWITTEKAGQVQRKLFKSLDQAAFCYLCGRRLGADTNNDEDHIIPKGMVKHNKPTTGAWLPMLPVHGKCHDEIKRTDEDAVLLHEAFVSRGQVVRPEIRRTGIRLVASDIPGVDTIGIKGASMFAACKTWIQGFHAFLYREWLPPLFSEDKWRFISPGLTEGTEHDIQELEDCKAAAHLMLHAAKLNGGYDGFRCWGDQVQYITTWPRQSVRGVQYCVWSLWLPGTEFYRAELNAPESPCWVGWYPAGHRPASASTVDGFEWLRLVNKHGLNHLITRRSSSPRAHGPR